MTAEELQALYQTEYDRELTDCQNKRGIYAEISLNRVWSEVLNKAGMTKELAERKSDKILMVQRLCAEKMNELFPNVKKELLALKEQGMKLLLLSNAQMCFIEEELPEDIVYVGDSAQNDMIPAGKYGCHCIMIGKKKQKRVALSHVT